MNIIYKKSKKGGEEVKEWEEKMPPSLREEAVLSGRKSRPLWEKEPPSIYSTPAVHIDGGRGTVMLQTLEAL